MQIFFSVGEPSGDLHGANLIRALRRRHPDIACVGYGGPRMAAAGCELHADLTQLAIMWILRVLLNIHKFWGLYQRAKTYFRKHRPDAVVLIDYPGFNWWIARAAKAADIPVFYYGTPQLWAWAGWRVAKMRRLVTHALCKLPFEADWFRERGCHATYVGHPYFDQLSQQRLDEDLLEDYRRRPGPLVAILPGSRTQEVTGNLPAFLRAAECIHGQVPHARFAIACFSEKHAAYARTLLRNLDVSIDVLVGRTQELIALSRCCLACSGSVSLELLYYAKPSVIHYSVGRFWGFIARTFFITVKYITLVNLLATDAPFVASGAQYDPRRASDPSVPMPEFLTSGDRSAEMAEYVVRWLTDERAYHDRLRQLTDLKAKYARPGASGTAAGMILADLGAAAIPPSAESSETPDRRRIPA